jgi:hypothetical protein
MSTLTIHPVDTDQETAIKLFLDALHVRYTSSRADVDDTEYLSASSAMIDRLNEAAQQEKNNLGVKVSIDDIWK